MLALSLQEVTQSPLCVDPPPKIKRLAELCGLSGSAKLNAVSVLFHKSYFRQKSASLLFLMTFCVWKLKEEVF